MPGPPNLRDITFFPPLKLLPHDNVFTDSDDDYYSTSVDRHAREPRKHWCFFAEITEPSWYPLRPTFQAKDIDGTTFLVSFYFDDRALFEKVIEKGLVGSTICVMYASLHFFADGQFGVRLEEPKNVKIIPLGLDKLFAANIIYRHMQSIVDSAGQISCVVCGASAAQRCSRCSAVSYCGRQCQEQDWKAKHKKECIAMRQMKAWSEFDWQEYKVHQGFTDFV
ncbi:hypothetical protein BDP27DRAFT_1337151 [Rhodocollybia butyracea]|uniref:MYND-type domain-containing protein n=1 Tax=Rhodocollybia butyracea TaxID=206335 RepID=A0A9P5U130_9AGAR|nr:hypothetical protein BDP27DRAFT_1337151 [Rhodocollybia butyracea]